MELKYNKQVFMIFVIFLLFVIIVSLISKNNELNKEHVFEVETRVRTIDAVPVNVKSVSFLIREENTENFLNRYIADVNRKIYGYDEETLSPHLKGEVRHLIRKVFIDTRYQKKYNVQDINNRVQKMISESDFLIKTSYILTIRIDSIWTDTKTKDYFEKQIR